MGAQPVTMFTPTRPGSDGIDGPRHAGHHGRRQSQDRGRGDQLDTLGDCGDASHQRETFKIVVPELGIASETTMLDHRQGEIQAEMLCLLHDLLVQLERRLVLRRRLRNQPTVVSDQDDTPTPISATPSMSRFSCSDFCRIPGKVLTSIPRGLLKKIQRLHGVRKTPEFAPAVLNAQARGKPGVRLKTTWSDRKTYRRDNTVRRIPAGGCLTRYSAGSSAPPALRARGPSVRQRSPAG